MLDRIIAYFERTADMAERFSHLKRVNRTPEQNYLRDSGIILGVLIGLFGGATGATLGFLLFLT